MGGYEDTFRRWRQDPEGFWAELARAVEWERPPRRILDDSRAPLYQWYPDGVLNTCHNALDRHVWDGRAEQAALIYDSPGWWRSWQRSPDPTPAGSSSCATAAPAPCPAG